MEISSEEQLLALEFGSRDELLVRVRSFYSKKGYALSTFRSEPNKGSKKKAYEFEVVEATIPSRENRFQVAKRRKSKSSTRRDPSEFEVVEAAWQGSSSNGVPHPNQMNQDTSTSTPQFQVPPTMSDDGVFGLIDLNMPLNI